VVRDPCRDPRHQRGREVVAHALDDFQPCTADVLRRVPAGGDGNERIAGPVDHQCPRRHLLEQPAAVARSQDGAQLARGAFRVQAAPGDPLEVRSQVRGVLQEAGAADDPEQVHQVVDDPVDVRGIVRRTTQQGTQCARLAQRDLRPGVPGRGHDRRQ